MILLDIDGYPSDEWLQYIRDFNENSSFDEFMDYLKVGWYWGIKLHRKYRGRRKLELHTGGWGGNELIIREIISNIMLTHFRMRYYMWKTGGHYYFEIIDRKN